MGTFWHDFYKSDLQAVYALWLVPLAFLAYLATRGRSGPSMALPGAERFVRAWAWFFCAETIVDPFATGPLLRWLGVAEGIAGTAIPILFVLLGDFRVLLLILALSQRTRPLGHLIVRTAVWTLIVPIAALAEHRVLTSAGGELGPQAIWLVYELCFVLLVIVLDRIIVPARVREAGLPSGQFLHEVLLYAGAYYALWALADILILGFGLDLGWALRIVPNQLYYAFFVPFVYWRFFAASTSAASQSTQAVR